MARARKTTDRGRKTVKNEARDEANKRRFVDQSGLAAQDLPQASHGQNVVDPADEMGRTLPQQHDGAMNDTSENYGEGGLHASMDISDSESHGHHGKHS
ncbi:MAG TPA: hypothetical protein VL282_01315 [Tepidisphaeraceae bacterium]|nr:hypothetical protein [Tepidisphaeraceae bacterium]